MVKFECGGLTFLLDDQDADLATWKWYPIKVDTANPYLMAKFRKKTLGNYVVNGKRRIRVHIGRFTKTKGMHRLILERKLGRFLTSDEVADHENRNDLDCRRDNLRSVTRSENGRNQRRAQEALQGP